MTQNYSRSWTPAVVSSQFILFPGTATPVTISDEKNLAAFREMQERGSKHIYIVTTKDQAKDRISLNSVYDFACLAEVEHVRGDNEKELQVVLRGIDRHRILDLVWDKPKVLVQAETVERHFDIDQKTAEAYLEAIKDLSDEIIAFIPGNLKQIAEMLRAIDEPELLINLIAPHLEVKTQQKIALLGEGSLKARLAMMLDLMQEMKQGLELRAELGKKVNSRIGKQNREAMLRQQMRLIQEELGERSDKNNYAERIEAHTELPEAIKEAALEEAERLAGMERNSPEAPGIQNYLDLILALPWSPKKSESIDLSKARAILNEHHYGLEKVKDRIVQHLAVLKMKSSFRGSILLLVGPPGVGKTSLGRSIAESMDREFVRASLGGVRDEAEIRGHRRTYLGSRPGRIIQALKQCKSNNPVFLLDEIDKLAQGYSGDPAAALLEVLDPEQNHSFRDHFLEQPYDLSKVMFIATANSLESIPGPLRDRMEIISVSGYTTAEKLHIAKQHLWPAQLDDHGIDPERLLLAEDALLRLVTHYTREAGVRDLKRKLATLIRGSMERLLATEGALTLVPKDLETVLGHEVYTPEVAEATMPAGVVTGLAWTPLGGDILFIEAKSMKGSGKLTLTGQMGDVMKESVQIAMTHARSLAGQFEGGLDFDKTDIHVHVPAGAIPKDGPSAGVTMLTALVSLLSQRPVNPRLAMTGEITLRGSVTAVGGIKEKVLAAHRAGIRTVILSEKNRKDIQDVPEEVRKDLTFICVRTVEELLEHALGLKLEPPAQFSPDSGTGLSTHGNLSI